MVFWVGSPYGVVDNFDTKRPQISYNLMFTTKKDIKFIYECVFFFFFSSASYELRSVHLDVQLLLDNYFAI